jgi:hypothetical protein
MIRGQNGHRLAGWSISAYWLILQAYPDAFRREFGESMAQVFSDAARDARNASGAAGLAVLWMRTLKDVVISLVRAYVREARDPVFRAATGLCLLYVCVLVSAVAYGAWAYREFYPAPPFSVFGAPEASEDALVASYEQALLGAFGGYRVFASVVGFSLAALLGLTAAVFGVAQKSILHGAGLLVAGVTITIPALSLLPTVWFPLDRYPVAALWLIGGGVPLAAGTWLVLALLTRLGSPSGHAGGTLTR